MKKTTTGLNIFLASFFFLSSCTGSAERELAQFLNSRPPGPTMPYENPRYILGSVPERLPFPFSVSANGKLLGTAEGWILLGQSSTEYSHESSWDFGYHETRAWLARLTVSNADAPNQYRIELRSVSP